MQSDEALIISLRLKLGRKRKGDGGLATQYRAAKALGILPSRLSEAVNGHKPLTKKVRAKLERMVAG